MMKAALLSAMLLAAGCATVPVRDRPIPREYEERYGAFITYFPRSYRIEGRDADGHDLLFSRWADRSARLYIDSRVFIEDADGDGSVDELIDGRRTVFPRHQGSRLREMTQARFDSARELLRDGYARATWRMRWDTCGGRCDYNELFRSRRESGSF